MRPRLVRCALVLAVVGSPAAAMGQLAPVEASLRDYVVTHDAEARALLERIVNINSGSMNFAGVREVGHVLAPEFTALGFEVTWVDGAPFDRAGHLVARREGPGRHLLLIGHLDTVFEADSPFQRFVMLNDSVARGPGIADMKGGDVIILQALRALYTVGALASMNITVVMTGDEEKSGAPLYLARQALVEAAEDADIALGFENGDGNPATAVVARRGFTGWELRATGTPAHSSQIFRHDVGAGAIFETARILNRFYTELAGEQYLTFNPGVILGGTTVEHDAEQERGTAFGKSNVVAEHAVVTGDLRTISLAQRDEARRRMEAIVGANLPGTTASITFRDSYPPLAPTDGNRRLLSAFDRVSRDLGFGPVTAVDPSAAGAADISFTAGLVDMAIDGLGMAGADDHTVNETGLLPALSVQAQRAAVLMYRLTRADRID